MGNKRAEKECVWETKKESVESIWEEKECVGEIGRECGGDVERKCVTLSYVIQQVTYEQRKGGSKGYEKRKSVCVCVREIERECVGTIRAEKEHTGARAHCNTLQHTALPLSLIHKCAPPTQLSPYPLRTLFHFSHPPPTSPPHTHNLSLLSYLPQTAVCCGVVVCCSVLQCAAVCCSVLQCVAVFCGVVQCVAVM